jgi:hypothetical protein
MLGITTDYDTRNTFSWRDIICTTGETQQATYTNTTNRSITTTNKITEYDRIQTEKELDQELYIRNTAHFSQAHGTPFTVPPLSDMLQQSGCTPESEEILKGNIPTNITKYTAMILRHLH